MTNSTEIVLKTNIKKYREKANLTQEQLSEMAGISPDYLSEIERGKKIPSMKRFFKIADALNLLPYKLLKP